MSVIFLTQKWWRRTLSSLTLFYTNNYVIISCNNNILNVFTSPSFDYTHCDAPKRDISKTLFAELSPQLLIPLTTLARYQKQACDNNNNSNYSVPHYFLSPSPNETPKYDVTSTTHLLVVLLYLTSIAIDNNYSVVIVIVNVVCAACENLLGPTRSQHCSLEGNEMDPQWNLLTELSPSTE